MKNTQRGFIMPLLLVLIAVLLVGGGVYVYTQKNKTNQSSTENVVLPQPTSTAQTYTNKSLGFSVDKPTGVYFMGEENGVVAFSLLSPDDPRQASSIGLVNVLTITSARTAPEGGKDVEINGENVLVSSTIGAYGGEKHWSYFFPNHDLLIQYVENKPLYEKMIGTIRFDE